MPLNQVVCGFCFNQPQVCHENNIAFAAVFRVAELYFMMQGM
jgi:hypothetical protein